MAIVDRYRPASSSLPTGGRECGSRLRVNYCFREIIFNMCYISWQADLNCNIQDDTGAFYGVTSQYESSENMTITCSTKVCSFGKQVVEKVEVRLSTGWSSSVGSWLCSSAKIISVQNGWLIFFVLLSGLISSVPRAARPPLPPPFLILPERLVFFLELLG